MPDKDVITARPRRVEQMKNENEELEVTTELEEVQPTPQVEVKKEVKKEVADQLTQSDLDKTVDRLIDQKLSLAAQANDNEEETPDEEEKEKKGLGVFPFIIFGVLGLGVISTILVKNRPDTSPTSPEVVSNG